jgi:ABC-2 type transport system permease protein
MGRALYELFLRSQATRGRLAALGLLAVVAIVLGISIALSHPDEPVRAGVELVNAYGLSLLAPVVTLVFASAALGDLVDDGTLVYVWLRPVPRWIIAVAALAASLTIALPLVVVPRVVAAAFVGGGDGALVASAALATALAVIAYSGVFVALGLRVKRALVWGLAYILIWEGFVARAGRNAGRLAVRSYTRSLLTHATGVRLRLASASVPAAVVVPIVVAVAAIAYTTWRLHRQEVP